HGEAIPTARPAAAPTARIPVNESASICHPDRSSAVDRLRPLILDATRVLPNRPSERITVPGRTIGSPAAGRDAASRAATPLVIDTRTAATNDTPANAASNSGTTAITEPPTIV